MEWTLRDAIVPYTEPAPTIVNVNRSNRFDENPPVDRAILEQTMEAAATVLLQTPPATYKPLPAAPMVPTLFHTVVQARHVSMDRSHENKAHKLQVLPRAPPMIPPAMDHRLAARRDFLQLLVASYFNEQEGTGEVATVLKRVRNHVAQWIRSIDYPPELRLLHSDALLKMLEDKPDTLEQCLQLEEPSAYNVQSSELSQHWKSKVLPYAQERLRKLHHMGWHDLEWGTRYPRILSLLGTLKSDQPHLIVTTTNSVPFYLQECLAWMDPVDDKGSKQRIFWYRRPSDQRPLLAEWHLYDIIICEYTVLMSDFLHLSQVPFHAIVMDDGVGWMQVGGHSLTTSNGMLRHVWDTALWRNTPVLPWAYFDQKPIAELSRKEARVGLSCRHRIVTSATMCVKPPSFEQWVRFLAPHLRAAVAEEWERCKTLYYLEGPVAQQIVVYNPQAQGSLYEQARLSLRTPHDPLPETVGRHVPDDEFIAAGKISASKRWTLQWLGSGMRYQLGQLRLEPVLDLLKFSNHHGHYCTQVTTASSHPAGIVTGNMAWKFAVPCGRHFGSEAALRQHIAAYHALPGTWLCRVCGEDCGTLQARTFHERACGQEENENTAENGNTGTTPNAGQGQTSTKNAKKKKKMEKDADGSIRVLGYRGVWKTKTGAFFVKHGDERLMQEDLLVTFDSEEAAAKKYDEGAKDGAELNYKEDGTRSVYDDEGTSSAKSGPASSNSGSSSGPSSAVPALSVINIKDLPPEVKPLLRDPRQTSRTGGNSKRHVYAYRGVCRQARKGHDRWQSQISFMGQNHYLGTFDSEWDAAAVYAWAHLILYGEEATKQAQKEGEEAAAAYEQEKKDIAAGKIPEPTKPEKKKRQPSVKKKKDGATPTKRKKADTNDGADKKKLFASSASTRNKEAVTPTLSKGVTKAPILGRRDILSEQTVEELQEMAVEAIKSNHSVVIGTNWDPSRACIPRSIEANVSGCALLLGLSVTKIGWEMQGFLERYRTSNPHMALEKASELLNLEYGEGGVNEKFATVVQGCEVLTLGCPNALMAHCYKDMGLGDTPLGGTIGEIDCNVGGPPGSCLPLAARLRFNTSPRFYLLSCLSSDTVVTHNGNRLNENFGEVQLKSGDLCSVGCRIFHFIEAMAPYS